MAPSMSLPSVVARRTALTLAAALSLAGCGGSPDPSPTGTGLTQCQPTGLVSIGEAIPAECSFELLDGGALRLGDLAGTPAVINFWAAWCTFCIEEMPTFQRVYASLPGRVEFVGANLLGVDGETRAAAQKFAEKTGVRYPLIYDQGGLLYGHFTANLVMPVTIFVRADGRVAHRKFGPFDEAQLREAIATHLGVR